MPRRSRCTRWIPWTVSSISSTIPSRSCCEYFGREVIHGTVQPEAHVEGRGAVRARQGGAIPSAQRTWRGGKYLPGRAADRSAERGGARDAPSRRDGSVSARFVG